MVVVVEVDVVVVVVAADTKISDLVVFSMISSIESSLDDTYSLVQNPVSRSNQKLGSFFSHDFHGWSRSDLFSA